MKNLVNLIIGREHYSAQCFKALVLHLYEQTPNKIDLYHFLSVFNEDEKQAMLYLVSIVGQSRGHVECQGYLYEFVHKIKAQIAKKGGGEQIQALLAD